MIGFFGESNFAPEVLQEEEATGEVLERSDMERGAASIGCLDKYIHVSYS
jgi:hypothetical protein